MKKIFSLLFIMIAAVTFIGCKEEKVERIDGELIDIIADVYNGISEETLAELSLSQMELDEDFMHLFTCLFKNDNIVEKINYEGIVISQPSFGTSTHRVVVIRMAEDAKQKDINDAITLLKENADLNWQQCNFAKDNIVESNGNLILFAMTDGSDMFTTIKENFLNLGK